MGSIDANVIVMQRHKRYFLQPGGAGPSNPLYYSGVDGAYMTIESTTVPRLGGVSPVIVHDPGSVGRWQTINTQREAPDLPSATVNFLQRRGVLPRHLTTLGDCPATFYEVSGDCKDLSDFNYGWSDKVKVLSAGVATSVDEGGSAFDSDEKVQDDVEFTFETVYHIGRLNVSDRASVTVYSELVDAVYGSNDRCADCGPANDGTKWVYALMKNTVASPGQAPSVVYTTDGGTTWTDDSIDGAASTDVPKAIGIAGNKLVVLTYVAASTGAIFYATINDKTGVPGTWTKTTTGLVSAKAPTDMWIESARSIWICGDGGYIYHSGDITTGVTAVIAGTLSTNNMARIDGFDDTVVAVGANDTILVSADRGENWSTATTSSGLAGLQALCVYNEDRWFVGDSAGEVACTEDGGNTWATKTLPGPTALAAIRDVVFITDEVGWIAASSSSPAAVLFWTNNGGRSWGLGEPRLKNVPTVDYISRFAWPAVQNVNLAVNRLIMVGLAGNGSDGALLVASSTEA